METSPTPTSGRLDHDGSGIARYGSVSAVHVVIMGCGRVGSTLARSLEDRNHTVSVIDSDPDAFRRLGPGVQRRQGDRLRLRPGGPGEGRHPSGPTPSPPSPAATTPTSSPRGWPARPSASSRSSPGSTTPGRAEVYQRLGITTVATVKWTADQVLRRLLPAGAEPDFRDPSGTIRVDQVPVPEAWVGQPHRRLPGAVRAAGSPGSTGSARACCPTRETRDPGGRPAPPGDARGERRRTSTQVIDRRTRGATECASPSPEPAPSAARSPAS